MATSTCFGTSGDHKTVTVRIPLAVRKRGGRRIVLPPVGSISASPRARVDKTIVKAVARGFRWRKILEDGEYSTIQDLAAAEGMNPSYVSRILRLALLAPALVENILEGGQGSTVTLDRLLRPFPAEWERQLRHF